MRSGAKMCACRSESWLPTRGSVMGRTPSRSPRICDVSDSASTRDGGWLCIRCASCFSCAHKTRLLMNLWNSHRCLSHVELEVPSSERIWFRRDTWSGLHLPVAADEERTLETCTPERTRATFTQEATPKTLMQEAPEAPDDGTCEDCWAHEPPRMQGANMSMPPDTYTCLIRWRSTSSDSSHSTWDIVDEKAGVPSAMIEALGGAEPLDSHLLAPRRRALKRPAALRSTDTFKDRRASPHVLCSPHFCRREKNDVAAARGDNRAKDE